MNTNELKKGYSNGWASLLTFRKRF